MKVTLQLNDGREITFEEVKNISILEEHFKSKKFEVKSNATEVAQVPTEGKWFRVDPLAIDQNLFKEKREDSRQEATRQYILQAFEEMKKNSKYARPFKTMIPEKTWERKTVKELKELAKSLGDHNADWVEQALEWAQRIANGESWEDICNKKDTANWYRLVVWKNGYARLVGGSQEDCNYHPASTVFSYSCKDGGTIYYTVPLVVSYYV